MDPDCNFNSWFIITVQKHRPGYDVHYKIIQNFSGGEVLHAGLPFVGYPANGEHTVIPDDERLLTGRSVVVGAGPGDSAGGDGAGDGVALAGGASVGDGSDMGMVVLSARVSVLSRVNHCTSPVPYAERNNSGVNLGLE
ncbi:hypothetical protein DFH09DRAFT_1069454 [Mycena vulgaris]|nr:hypothetical protein DFH09DRAFT_1069454 [Mycena vulgaris]